MEVSNVVWATIAALLVSASFPFYLYGAWIILDEEVVTWSILRRHLAFVLTGLVLTTVPVVFWMVPRLFYQLGGLAVLHAVIGVHAYAFLVFALTGIAPLFRAKLAHDLYGEAAGDTPVDEIHENASTWRSRLRIGVFGYVVLWILAYVLGMWRYFAMYRILPW